MQAQMTTFHNRCHNYKKNTRFSLPSQQSAFNTAQQHQQWPLPPKPTPPMTFHHSTPTTASLPSTRKSPISSIISRMSGTLPPHPYHQTPLPPTNGNNKQLSSSSRKSMPKSRCSSISSTWRTTTDNTAKLHSLFEDSPVSADVNWGEVNWGPAPQWEQPLPPPQDEPQAK